MKQTNLTDMFKKASNCVYASATGVSPDPLSPTPSTSSAMKTPKSTEEDTETWKQQMEEISKWNTPLITVFTHMQGEVFSK